MKKMYIEPDINTKMFKTEAYMENTTLYVSAELETVPEEGSDINPFAY